MAGINTPESSRASKIGAIPLTPPTAYGLKNVKNAFKTYESKIQLHSYIGNKNSTPTHMGKCGKHSQQETLTIHIRLLIEVHC
jgi:hypothetical protein